MVHAALLLLMLEASNHGPRIHHQMKRSYPKSSAIHKLGRPDYPSLGQWCHFDRAPILPVFPISRHFQFRSGVSKVPEAGIWKSSDVSQAINSEAAAT